MRSILLAVAAAAVVTTSAHAWEQMEARPPMFVPHGQFMVAVDPDVRHEHRPFMVAVDPDGTIVNSQRLMILYPKEFSAMAQETAPLTTPLPRSRPKKR